jgi:hypothetical protein
VNRAELIERARRAHEESGRGMIVKLIDGVEPRYVPIEEAKTRLVQQGVEPEHLFAAIYAVRKYDTKRQCVLFLELEECCTVNIVAKPDPESNDEEAVATERLARVELDMARHERD